MRPVLGFLSALAALLPGAGAQAQEARPAPVAPTPADRVEASFIPTWLVKATLYHGGARGVGPRDALGCRTVPMRTAAVDPHIIPRRAVLFIAETVGMPLPGGGRHDGYWYASDTGGAIKGARIDLFTGETSTSMGQALKLSLKRISASQVGRFDGCPRREPPAPAR